MTKKIVVFTGAGVSAESELGTFFCQAHSLAHYLTQSYTQTWQAA